MVDSAQLRRELDLFGAVVTGLGSILGTGIFVSIGLAAEVTGPAVMAAIAAAAVLATCNGLSSARLAAVHPVSGGTYEYACRLLNPATGFIAGWMFLCAKSASAATAALGIAGYLTSGPLQHQLPARNVTAGLIVLVVGCALLMGTRRTALINAVIVTVTVGALSCFVISGLPFLLAPEVNHLSPFFLPADGRSSGAAFAEACALMFVAFTGYGRIATLGEEVHTPSRTIPRAILITIAVTAFLCAAAAWVAVAAVGSSRLAELTVTTGAPLPWVAEQTGRPRLAGLMVVGGVTAMTGVLLNLVLGLSRVVLAMGRRGDLPQVLASVQAGPSVPRAAVILMTALVALLTLTNDIRNTWSLSAVTVLLYYAITNLSALRLPPAQRRLTAMIPATGLTACVGLATQITPNAWGLAALLLTAGFIVRIGSRIRRTSTDA